MKTLRFILLSIFFVILFSTISIAQSESEKVDKKSWSIILKLDMKQLKPPAVLYALFDKDPTKNYKSLSKKMKDYSTKFLENAQDADFEKKIMMKVWWNKGFHTISGDEVHLLTYAPNVMHGISSDNPGGKKWIVTKVVYIKGKPICWTIPITIRKGQEYEVTLNEQNIYDLNTIFNEVVFNTK